ncbi:MAG TPA: hypothetical protein VJT49_00720 [Amycolatopsis sp.]|uniref:ATP-grasp domain-containing protein n=1 Tax=Amycolatopsis sp. TaxID=37632 RepID=UPI002B48BA8A|nr:hypothetical protein [Amycolatopsis sp.]HKS43638.1 hypothetical protein [Amycolatopsis sp.]
MVREFASEAKTVTKMFGAISIVEAGERHFAHTMPLEAADLADLRGIEVTTHLFQQWARKEFEARMFVVGDEITTAAIYSHTASAYIDWRTGYDTNTYSLIDAPADVIDAVRQLMAELHLTYGALDFVIGPDGEWTFLESTRTGSSGGSKTRPAHRLPINSLTCSRKEHHEQHRDTARMDRLCARPRRSAARAR